MQKISSYLYPNRIELLADLAGFTTEYTNVYQKTVKIYKGVDNVLEFDIKNADQKRLNLTAEDAVVTDIMLNVMDASGYAVGTYEVTPLNQTTHKGIATVTIPSADVVDIKHQFLKYSVTYGTDPQQVLYADSRFGAIGTIELIGSAVPVVHTPRVYTKFSGEIDLNGNVINYSPAIPTTFYEAIPTTSLSLSVKLTDFTGTIWLQGTKDTTISVDSFKFASTNAIDAPYIATSKTTGILELFPDIQINDYKYFRVCYQSLLTGGGASFNITRSGFSYDATLVNAGSKYAVGSIIRILGSTLDGADGSNDLIITVTEIDTIPGNHIVQAIAGFTVSGVAVGGTGSYLNKTGIVFAGKVDSVTVL